MRKTIRIWEFILLDSIKLLSDKVLGKIKMIKGIQKFDYTKILFNTNDKLADEVTLKNVVILISFVISFLILYWNGIMERSLYWNIGSLSIESTLRKLFFKLKDRVATEDKNNIVYEIHCSNCEAVYFNKSKRSLKSRSDEHKRSFRNFYCDKNKIDCSISHWLFYITSLDSN